MAVSDGGDVEDGVLLGQDVIAERAVAPQRLLKRACPARATRRWINVALDDEVVENAIRRQREVHDPGEVHRGTERAFKRRFAVAGADPSLFKATAT